MIPAKVYREGIIEALRLAASAKMQIDYQSKVPNAQVVAEIFCWWEDIYKPSEEMTVEAFTLDEVEALAEYEKVLTQTASTIRSSQLVVFQDSEEFGLLAEAAKSTLLALKVAVSVAD